MKQFFGIFFVNFIAACCHVLPSQHMSVEAGVMTIHELNNTDSESVWRTARNSGTKKASSMVQTQCQPTQACYSDLECPGGRCLGLAVGKCNCGACMTFAHCISDADCGGLQRACTDNHYCDCDKGFQNAGFEGYLDALVKICNLKECIPNTLSCHGLPCNAGFCTCPV